MHKSGMVGTGRRGGRAPSAEVRAAIDRHAWTMQEVLKTPFDEVREAINRHVSSRNVPVDEVARAGARAWQHVADELRTDPDLPLPEA